MTEPFDPMRPWLLERARLDPGRLAISCGGVTVDFATLAEGASALADRLSALGIVAGDRVALLASASIRWAEWLHAAQILGAVLVPLNTRLSPVEIARLVEDCRPKLVAFDEACRPLAEAVRDDAVARVECDREIDAVPAAGRTRAQAVDPRAVFTILYTSGTTGVAKGALLTHGNHWASALASGRNLGADPADRWLLVLPPHHVGGLSVLLRSVIDGSGVVLHAGFDPVRVDRALRDGGVTLVSLVSTTLARLLDVADGRPYPAVRAVLLGGGPIPPELVTRARTIGLPVLPTYGLTETASQVTTAALGEALPAGSAGRPLAGTEVRIAEAAADGCGEILVRGPTVMRGYLGRPDDTERALREGWLHTGDLGRLDEQGYLYVADRRSDLIVSGGENVYPAEVEAALLAHPDVLEAAVYPAPDPVWGQRVVAALVLRPDRALALEALRRWLDGRLARFKWPREIHVVEALPRTASGKIRRRELRERFASGS